MSTELSNGVIIPEEYSDDWYDEMSINLRKLNDVITAASDNATDIQRLDTDKANQSDLTALTSRVSQNETDIIALQTAVSGALKREIVQTLPTQDISTTTIYMIRNSQSSGTNIYDEYMYINSQWELIGTSATDFSNYYTKNETDNLLSGKVDNSTLGSYYTKTESDNLLSAKANQTDLTALSGRVTQTETDITALQTAVSGALKREIVQSLPTQDISTTTIYMIRNSQSSGTNIYDEYMYINNLWELIGTSATDFSNYYTKTEIDTLLSGKADDNSVVHTRGNETSTGFKQFANIRVTNSIKGINLADTTIDLNNCYSAFDVESKGGNLQYYYCNTDSETANISNLPEAKAFFLASITTRLISNSLYVKQILINSNSKTFTRYCNNSIWSSWVNETDSEYVHKSGNETIDGNKIFRSNTTIYNSDTSANTPNLILQSSKIQLGDTTNSDSQGLIFNAGNSFVAKVDSFKDSSGTQNLQNHVRTRDTSNNVITAMYRLRLFNSGVAFLETSGDNTISLGRNNSKWKDCQTYLINGLTPSRLSLPSTTGVVDISSYITDLTGTANTYTVLVNGYIQFDVTGSSVEIDVTNGLSQKWIMTDPKGFIPVVSGASVSIKVVGTAINNFKFIPCQGNI